LDIARHPDDQFLWLRDRRCGAVIDPGGKSGRGDGEPQK
jgi:hypothetical protein